MSTTTLKSAIRATSSIPWLPATSELGEELPSLAEQVATMLHVERQVMILITGNDHGRMSGFMAELTHAVSHGDTVLRIKAELEAQELFVLLASQLHLPTQNLTSTQLATQLGMRLRQDAPQGNFVLLCEGAQNYSAALLENIRQLSNYPINIVLSGKPKLLRRLWRPGMFALRQRLNYRLSLNEWTLASVLKLLFALIGLGAGLWLGWVLLKDYRNPMELPAVPAKAYRPAATPAPVQTAPTPITVAPAASDKPIPPASEQAPSIPEAETPDNGSGLKLILEPSLQQAPKKK